MDEQRNIKPIYKKWWFLIVIIIIIGGFFTSTWVTGHDKSKQNDEKLAQKGQNSNPKQNTSDSRKKQYGIVADFTPSSMAGFNYAGPTIVDDFIYIGTSTRIAPEGTPREMIARIKTNYFYKLDLNLKLIWQYELGKTMVSGGGVLDSKKNIYFVTEDFSEASGGVSKEDKFGLSTELNLISLSADGKFRWKKKISKTGGEPWHHATVYPAVGTDNTIYVADSKFFSFDTEGNMKWQYPINSDEINGLRSAPIIDKTGNIYFASPEPNASGQSTDKIKAYKFTSTGNLLWSQLLGNEIMDPEGPYNGNPPNGGGYKENLLYSSPAFSVGEKYLYVPVGSTLNKVDAATGKIVWSLKPEGATGSFKSNPSVDGQDNIYIGTKSNDESTLFAIDASGKIIWKKLIGGDIYPTPVLGDDGKLYVLTEQGKGEEEATIFRTVDIKTGESSNKIDDKGPLCGGGFSASAIYKGFMYSTSGEPYDDQGNLKNVAIAKRNIDANGYPADSPWPKGHGRNDNSGRSYDGGI